MTESASVRRTIFIVSDASGERASAMVSVLLEQFRNVSVTEQRFPEVRTPAQIAQIMHAAAKTHALVVYTLVGEGMAETAKTAADGLGIIAVNLFEQLLPSVSQWLGAQPSRNPGHAFDEKYFARLEAIFFAQRNDDGKNLQDLLKADVVVLGLSRTGKTPVCRALADHRVLAANIPIVPGISLPTELQEVDPRRVYVLQMGLDRLLAVRSSRLNSLGMDAGAVYVDRDAIRAEVLAVTRLLTLHPEWARIDVTRCGVEEAAAMIMAKHQERFPQG